MSSPPSQSANWVQSANKGSAHTASPGGQLTSRHFLTRRGAILGLLGCAVCLTLGLIASRRPSPAGAAAADPDSNRNRESNRRSTGRVMPVETMTLDRVSSFSRRREFTGIVKPKRESQLGFRRSDALAVIRVDQGDRVSAGDVLAELDRRSLEAQKASLNAKLSEAQAVLAERRAGPRQQVIAAQRATVDDLQAQQQRLAFQHTRRKGLLQQNAVSQESYEQSLFELESFRAKTEAARQQLDELLAGTRPERLLAQEAVVKQLQAALVAIDVDVEDSTLVAPYDGAITRRYLDEGTIVAVGDPLFRIVESGELEAWIGIPPDCASRIRVGDEWPLAIGQQTMTGRVRAVTAELDPQTRTRTIVFEFAQLDADSRSLAVASPPQALSESAEFETNDAGATAGFAARPIVPGEVVRIEIDQDLAAEGFWVPMTALVRGAQGLWAVYVVQAAEIGDELAFRDVEVLHSDDRRAFIRGLIDDGERVVTRGTHRLVAGQSVAPQTASGK